jgi:hypothetical protein
MFARYTCWGLSVAVFRGRAALFADAVAVVCTGDVGERMGTLLEFGLLRGCTIAFARTPVG